LIKDEETMESTRSLAKKKSQKEFNGFLLAIPAMFYLASCVLQNTALSKINSSTFMLLRSSLMVFTAILNQMFTTKRYHAHHLLAILTVASGLAIVSYLASVYREDRAHDNEATSTSSHMWYIFLVLASQFCMACQYTTE
jgi:drug/metabolite transporter (DMT)-like permease